MNKKRARFEQLERRELLTILWANADDPSDTGSNLTEFNANQGIAQTIIQRAVDDWKRLSRASTTPKTPTQTRATI